VDRFVHGDDAPVESPNTQALICSAKPDEWRDGRTKKQLNA
jgi:hypothetical protein